MHNIPSYAVNCYPIIIKYCIQKNVMQNNINSTAFSSKFSTDIRKLIKY